MMQAHLEHEDGAAEEGAVQEEFEDEGRGDLVRHVGNANVKEGQLSLDDITHHDLQLLLVVGPLHPLLQLGHHPGVQLTGSDLLDLVQHLDCQVTRTRPNLQHCVCVSKCGLKQGIIMKFFVSVRGLGRYCKIPFPPKPG